MSDERTFAIPEMRGMSRREYRGDGFSGSERDPERPYSASSYAAQYGIDVETATEFVESYDSHPDIEGAIYQVILADPETRTRALALGELGGELTEEDKAEADEFLRRFGR